jgi:hypothetical protein
MAHIRIDDLPPDTDLTPEELEQIYGGAGRRSFIPTIESLESREMYAASVTAQLLTSGVLSVRGQHIQGTPNNDAVTLRRTADNKGIEVISGAGATEQLVRRIDDATQVKAIDLLMTGGNALVDFTGLGKLGGDARLNTKPDGGWADVRYIDKAGRQVREWDSLDNKGVFQRHNKETKVGKDTVLEQSWQPGNLTPDFVPGKTTLHFVKVTDSARREVITGQDNGNGFFEVTTTDPGVRQYKAKFDKYGGMWDGKAWVPEQGQKLEERDGKRVTGEWKTINNQLRWVVTTGSPQSNGSVETSEGYGQNGYGGQQLSVEVYRDGNLSQRRTFDFKSYKLTVTKFGVEQNPTFNTQTTVYNIVYTVKQFQKDPLSPLPKENLVTRETVELDGKVVREFYEIDKLSRRESGYPGVSWVKEFFDYGGKLIKRESLQVNSNGPWVKEVFDGSGALTNRDAFNRDGTLVQEVWKDGVYTRNVWKMAYPGDENVFKPYNPGDEGSANHLQKTVIKKGAMWVTAYHLKGVVVYKGALYDYTTNGTVSWGYSLNDDNTIKSLTWYKASQNGWDYTAEWSREHVGADPDSCGNWYKNGWLEWRPGQYGGYMVPPLPYMYGSDWAGWNNADPKYSGQSTTNCWGQRDGIWSFAPHHLDHVPVSAVTK